MGVHFLGFVFMCHAIVRGARLLPELIRPRSSRAFTVLRLADAGRTTSSSFKRRKTGSPPSESVSSWYPCSMCQIKSCSAGKLSNEIFVTTPDDVGLNIGKAEAFRADLFDEIREPVVVHVALAVSCGVE